MRGFERPFCPFCHQAYNDTQAGPKTASRGLHQNEEQMLFKKSTDLSAEHGCCHTSRQQGLAPVNALLAGGSAARLLRQAWEQRKARSKGGEAALTAGGPLRARFGAPLEGLLGGSLCASLGDWLHRRRPIRAKFRSIISDQKRRAAFADGELRKTPLKALLTADARALGNPRTAASGEGLSGLAASLGPGMLLENSMNPTFAARGFSRIRNRCLLTGRPAIIGKYRLSRICFRRRAGSGAIPGLTKNIV